MKNSKSKFMFVAAILVAITALTPIAHAQTAGDYFNGAGLDAGISTKLTTAGTYIMWFFRAAVFYLALKAFLHFMKKKEWSDLLYVGIGIILIGYAPKLVAIAMDKIGGGS